jgi:hypothetical protein
MWFVLLCASIWKDSSILNLIFSGVSLVLGTGILVCDPRTEISKRVGYRPIGITLIVAGTTGVFFEMFRKFILPHNF